MKPKNEFLKEFFFNFQNLEKDICYDDQLKKENCSLFNKLIKEKNEYLTDEIQNFFVDIINHLKRSKEILLKEKDNFLNKLKSLLNFDDDNKKEKIKNEFEKFQKSMEINKNDPDLLLINYLNFKSIFKNFENYKKNFQKDLLNIKNILNQSLKDIKIEYNQELLKPIGILNKNNLSRNNFDEIEKKDSLLFDNLIISEIEENCSNLIKEGENEDFLLLKSIPKFESNENIFKNRQNSSKEINLFMDQSIGNISELNDSKIQNVDFEILEDRFSEKIKNKKNQFDEIRSISPFKKLFSTVKSTKIIPNENSHFFKKSYKMQYNENTNGEKKPFLKNGKLLSEKIIKPFSKKKKSINKELASNEKILKNFEKKNLEELDLSYSSKIKRYKGYKYKIFNGDFKKK